MANSSPGSRIKLILLGSCLCVAAGVAGGVSYANMRLERLRIAVERESARLPGQRMTIGRIQYIPPHIVVIRDARFTGTGPLLHVPATYVRLSLAQLLKRRQVVVSDVVCDSPRAFDPDFYRYLNEHGRKLLEYLFALPQQDIRLTIRNAALNERGSLRSGRNFSSDVGINLKNGSLSVTGRLYEETLGGVCSAAAGGDRCIRRRLPYEFRLNGFFAGTALMMESLEISRENMYAKLWGSVSGKELALKGYSFIDSTFEEREYVDSRRLSAGQRGISFFALFAGLPELRALQSLKMEDVDMYVLDIDGSFTLQLPACTVNRLKFSLNNVPLALTGKLRLGSPAAFDVTAVSEMEKPADKRLEHFKKVSLKARGMYSSQTLSADGTLDIIFGKAGQDKFPYERTVIDFEALGLTWKGYPELIAQAQRIGIACSTGSNTYAIPLSPVHAAARFDGSRSLSVAADGGYHDGRFNLRGTAAFAELPLKVDAFIRIRDVSAEKMSGLLIHFSKVQGKVFSQMRFRNSPVRLLKGGMSIAGGRLNEFEFFVWLADFVGIEALRSVSFSRALAYFSVDEAGAKLNKIALTIPDLSLRGYFALGRGDMVASKLSLQLGRELLSRSEKFKPIVRLLPEDAGSAAFDFQLSGVLNAMNFQWLDSPLKTRVRSALPGFIERHIEQSVETMIDEANP